MRLDDAGSTNAPSTAAANPNHQQGEPGPCAKVFLNKLFRYLSGHSEGLFKRTGWRVPGAST
eukprot:6469049-Lingulodinium_polyedra.AAC.1